MLSCSIEGFEGQPLTGAKSAVKSRLLAPWVRLSSMCASLGRESADDGDIVSSAINALGRLATSILLLALHSSSWSKKAHATPILAYDECSMSSLSNAQAV